jgi:hypothetical protein
LISRKDGLAVGSHADVDAPVAGPVQAEEHLRRELAQPRGELSFGHGKGAHLRVLDPLEVEVLERLAVRKEELDRGVRGRRKRIVRVLGHEDGELAALDELLDQRGAELGGHPLCLVAQRRRGLDAGVSRHPDARVAGRMLDDEREAQVRGRPLDVVRRHGDVVARRLDAPGVGDPLHRLPARVVELRGRSRERDTEPLEGLHDLDPRPVLAPRAVADVEEEVEAPARELDDSADRRRLLQRHGVPFDIGEIRTRVTREVVVLERRRGVGVCVRQQADPQLCLPSP